MPTINQLVRKPRQTASKKSKSPALGRIHNALKVRYYNQNAPLERERLCAAPSSASLAFWW